MVHKWSIRLSTIAILIILSFSCFTPSINAESLPVMLFSKGSISFNLTGAEGEFREGTSASYRIDVNKDKKMIIKFEASELRYEGSENVNLDAIYWVNDNTNQTFSANKSLVFLRRKGSYLFSIHGQVTINAIEAQPSGKYKGTITVTVYEDRS